MRSLNALDWIAIILVFIGALNWGLVGLFSFDLVRTLFGDMSIISRLVYIVIAIAGIYLILLTPKLAKKE